MKARCLLKEHRFDEAMAVIDALGGDGQEEGVLLKIETCLEAAHPKEGNEPTR